jgi:hypothetical protein
MTIPTEWAWPLGCMVLIGLLHTVLLIEEVVHQIIRRLHDAIHQQEEA